jgi:hypothetical protein
MDVNRSGPMRSSRERPSSCGRSVLAVVASWAALSLLGLVGCGGPGPYTGSLYPVKGRVLPTDGTPLAGGTVLFIPSRGGLPASGKIAADGTFSLKSKSRDGAAPGEYKVRIEPSAERLARKGRAAPKLPFASKYREYDGSTGLTATINAGETQLEPFRLEAR